MTRTLLMIGIGGAAGSILRYLTSLLVSKTFPHTLPLATLVVNVMGCLLIGMLLAYFDKQQVLHSDLKLLLITGFCGGYTTFSAFAAENIKLLQSGNTGMAFLYIALSLLLCLAAVWLGLTLFTRLK